PNLNEVHGGMIARVFIEGPLQELMIIPTVALAKGDVDRGAVFILQDSLALMREVGIIAISGDSIYIQPDIPDGSMVITRGAGYLSDGSRVQLSEGAVQ
ncbi:hypothetical protein ACFLQJ_02815, partial [Calditrichota bacterium]